MFTLGRVRFALPLMESPWMGLGIDAVVKFAFELNAVLVVVVVGVEYELSRSDRPPPATSWATVQRIMSSGRRDSPMPLPLLTVA